MKSIPKNLHGREVTIKSADDPVAETPKNSSQEPGHEISPPNFSGKLLFQV